MKRFWNSVIVALSASALAVVLGSLAAYGLSRFSYRFAWMRNKDISFFFLSQLILPPVVLALPFLVLYKELALLDTRVGIILVYTLTVLPIVIWIMRDQFSAIPVELEEAALVDGLVGLGRLPADRAADRPAGHGGGLHPQPGALLERVLLRRAADLDQRQHPAGDGGEPDRAPGHQLVVDGGALFRGDHAAGGDRRRARALHHPGHGRRRGEVATRGQNPAGPQCISVARRCARTTSRPRSPSSREAPAALSVYQPLFSPSRFRSTASGASASISEVSPIPAWSNG